MRILTTLVLLLLAPAVYAQQIPAPGQGTMANSIPVVLASDQSNVNVVCASGCSGGTTDTDDGSIAAGQVTAISLGLSQIYDGAVWRRLTFGQALMASSIPVTIASNQTAVPISAAALPLPAGASTLVEQQTQTTALQLLDNIVSGNGANITQFGGTNVVTGVGAAGSGVPRVTTSNDNIEATGTVAGTGSYTVALAGMSGVGFYITTGCTCTFFYEFSWDNGTTYSSGVVIIGGVQQLYIVGHVNPAAAVDGNVVLGEHWTHFRVRVSAYTSGSPVVWVHATKIISPLAVGALSTVSNAALTGIGANSLFTTQVGGTAAAAAIKPLNSCDTQVVIAQASATTTELVALSGTTRVRICAYSVASVGAAGPPTWKFVYGTGASCGTGTTNMMGAQSGSTTAGDIAVFSVGSGTGEILRTAAGTALCITSTTTASQAGWVTYAQY